MTTVHRSGYIIPNASDADINSLQAEPDAGDFSILGNNTFGVLSGGVCTDGGGTGISVSAGAFLIDGEIVTSTSGSVTLSVGASSPRFDLVGYDTETSQFAHIAGEPSLEPKFAFIPDTFVVLAAVFINSLNTTISASDIVDKRHLLLSGARGAVSGVSTFIRNSDPDTGSALFSVTGAGTISWGGTSSLSSNGTDVTVSGKINANTGIGVTGNADVSGDLAVTGVATSSNFKRGAGDPNSTSLAGNPGDIYSRTNGQQFTYLQSGTWAEIYADEYPPGTVLSSLLEGDAVTTFMGAGWLKFGATYANADVGRLASMGSNFAGWYNSGSGQWTLPDLSNTFLAGSALGSLNGVPAVVGDNAVTISTAQLPSHKHFDGSLVEGQLRTSAMGSHVHTVSSVAAGGHSHSVSGGLHGHPINDPHHSHSANHGNNIPANFVATLWGGGSKLDGPIADKSHTWTVDAALYTTDEPTGVTVQPNTGNHSHSVAAVVGHTHTISAAAAGEHFHTMPTESGAGSGSPVDVTPKHLKVHYYLKV
jgi:hypothetical protein